MGIIAFFIGWLGPSFRWKGAVLACLVALFDVAADSWLRTQHPLAAARHDIATGAFVPAYAKALALALIWYAAGFVTGRLVKRMLAERAAQLPPDRRPPDR